MKLGYNPKAADPIYKIQETVRYGEKTITETRSIIGRHSDLLKRGITDPLQYARDAVAAATAEANAKKEKHRRGELDDEEIIRIDMDEKLSSSELKESRSTALNIGYFYLQHYYQRLGLKTFFDDISKDRRFTYDCNDINRFLTYGRILEPRSKLGTYDRLDTYFEKPEIAYQHILRFLDVLDDHYDSYISHLFRKSNTIHKRNTSICYYDCTNFYFEKEKEDDDYIDPVTGEVMSGLGQYGPSKENKPNPIVEMGLFMDADGIPLTMCIHPGNKNEQQTALPEEKKLLEMFKGKPFIYCADGGLNSYKIRSYNSMGSRAFIVTQSVKKLSSALQTAVFNDFDYRRLSNNTPASLETMKSFDKEDSRNLDLYKDKIYKVITADKAVDTGLTEMELQPDGSTKCIPVKGELKQFLIITFSRKVMEYQRYIRSRQVERAKKLLETRNPEEIKKGPHDVRRFIKGTNKKDVNSWSIDYEKIAKEEKYDGFYCIATNIEVLNSDLRPDYDEVLGVLKINGERYKIEDCFRIMKSNFCARPIFVSIPPHIKAHFMICFTALLILRLLEFDLNKDVKDNNRFSICNIINTLRVMNVAQENRKICLSTYTGSLTLHALEAKMKLGLNKKHYEIKELTHKIKELNRIRPKH